MAKVTNKIRVLTAKVSLDGHWRGVAVVSRALRDGGMEVIYAGPLKGSEIARTAIQEDVDVIGLSVCGRYEEVGEVIRILKEQAIDDMLIIVGGTVPPEDIPALKKMGVAEVFPPGSSLDAIVKYVKDHVNK